VVAIERVGDGLLAPESKHVSNPQNYITEDTTIKGSITTASSLTIAGAIEGDVNAGGEITVLDDALVKGDISGPNVKILGKVEGRVSATGRLEISASGQVIGDISVRALHIEEGGTLQGECNMGGKVAAKPAPKPTASSSASARVPVSNLPPPGGG
jgi:cytoskeletal protein CcmA (bactofilin family)